MNKSLVTRLPNERSWALTLENTIQSNQLIIEPGIFRKSLNNVLHMACIAGTVIQVWCRPRSWLSCYLLILFTIEKGNTTVGLLFTHLI